MDVVSPVSSNWQAHLKRKAAIWDRLSGVVATLRASGGREMGQLTEAMGERRKEMAQLRALNTDLSQQLHAQRTEAQQAEAAQAAAAKQALARVAVLEEEVGAQGGAEGSGGEAQERAQW